MQLVEPSEDLCQLRRCVRVHDQLPAMNTSVEAPVVDREQPQT